STSDASAPTGASAAASASLASIHPATPPPLMRMFRSIASSLAHSAPDHDPCPHALDPDWSARAAWRNELKPRTVYGVPHPSVSPRIWNWPSVSAISSHPPSATAPEPAQD